ncbi:acylphosphatase [Planctomonas deserti]|uniref:acylphosphatase n=1 Tax=Planctomonas deserti TaxID=2144185 RepID=UPI000D393380|nr:acylphosphatase [Planctomonas deserti]
MTGEERIRRRAIVHGVVQGVGFRASTREQARGLGVSGVARNLLDGTVEVEAEGPPRDVDALLAWLRQGPAWARVDRVDVTELPATGDVAPFGTG